MKSQFARVTLALGLAFAVGAQAQSMQETASRLGVAAGKAYFAPVVSAMGSNLNGGWYHKAPAPKKFGFHVEAGAITMATLLSGGNKTFGASGAFRLDSAAARNVADDIDTTGMFGQGQQVRDSAFAAIRRSDVRVNFTGPTIIGGEDDPISYVVETDPLVIGTPGGGQDTITLPATTDTIRDPQSGEPIGFGILDGLTALPLVAPQITVGTVYGTNVTLRWLPEQKTTEEIGKIKFFGFGIQHNPGVWFNSQLPVDLSVGYFTQKLTVGTLFEAQSQAVGLNISKTLGWRFLNVTPYGGIQLEKSTFDFSYKQEVDDEEVQIDFTLEGENKYRATAGVSVRLFVVNLNADYNIGKYNSMTIGVMVGI